jgi:Tfp pilus assembly protein PilN
MAKRHCIALNIGPDGLQGAKATTGPRGAVVFEHWTEKKWNEPPAADLSGLTGEIEEFLNTLQAQGPHATHGVFSIHPSWSLTRPVEVPPAGKADTLRFLQMQVERQQALLRGGQIVWSHRLHPAEADSPLRKAFLVLCKEEVVRPVEAAFRACKIQPVFASVSSLIAGLWACECPDFPTIEDYLLVLVEAGGSTSVEYAKGRVTRCQWIPSPGENANGQRFATLAVNLAKRKANNTLVPVLICGPDQDRACAMSHLRNFEEVREFAPLQSPKGFSFAAEARNRDFAQIPIPLSGLLLQQALSDTRTVNLLDFRPPTAPWTEKFAFLKSTWFAVPLNVALFTCLFYLSYAAMLSETRLFQSIDISQEIVNQIKTGESNRDILRRFEKERTSHLDILLDITQALPDGVLLSTLRIDKKGDIIFTGQAASFAATEEIARKINASPLLTKAKTERMGRSQPNGPVAFRIKCSTKDTGGASSSRKTK